MCLIVLSDFTERKFREDDRELTSRLITLINTPGDVKERMSELTVSLQGWSGCEAVGIRLRAGDDYPYYETTGFPPEFVQAEKYLCAYGPDGKILHDGTGNPVLECMCGNILCGRFDPVKPFFTAHGSFWSNSTTALLVGTTEADRQARTRNRCNGMGYESVALIPLRTGDQVFGLIQFNDHRPNRYTPDLIDHLERMADSLAIALSHRQTEEILRESEERFRKLFQYHSAVKLVIDPDTGDIIDANEAAAQFYGWPLEELKRMCIQQINVLPPDAVKAEMKKAASSESTRFEFRHRKADGSIREVEVFTNKIEISGKYLLYSIIQDISERKQAEKMLNLHLAIMETVAEGIFLIGLEDNIIKWTNSKFEELFGYGPGEMVGMHVDKVNAPTEKTPTETRISIVDLLRQTGEWHGELNNHQLKAGGFKSSAESTDTGRKTRLLFFHFYSFIRTWLKMVLKISFYHFVSNLTRSCTKIPSCPKMSPPISLFKMRKFFQQFRRSSSLYPSHYLTWSHIRWRRDKHMYVILAHNSTYDIDLKCLTGLTNKLFYSKRHFIMQYLVAIFCYPYKMILNIENRMTSVPIFHKPSCSRAYANIYPMINLSA